MDTHSSEMISQLVFASSLLFSVSAAFHLPKCDPTELPTDVCPYGEGFNGCGGRICLRGPKEVCGGKEHYFGKCADGLVCSNCFRFSRVFCYIICIYLFIGVLVVLSYLLLAMMTKTVFGDLTKRCQNNDIDLLDIT